MTCRRAFDLDLAAYLVDPRAAEWTDFRHHWPTCADCAAEVAAWTTLQARLGASHPDAEVLLRWADGGDAMPAADRLAVARHVEACASCTDELRALARFDTAPLLGTTPAAPPPKRPWTLRRVLWNPALAYALLLLALLPSLNRRHEMLVVGEPEEPPAAAAPAPAKRRAEAPATPKPADAEAPGGFAASPRSDDAASEGRARGLGGAAPAPPPPPAPALERKAAAPPPMAEQDARGAEPAPQPAARAKTAPAESRRAPATTQDAPRAAEAPSFLTIPLPDAARAAGTVEVRIQDAAGDRELRERFPVHPDLAVLSFELPPSWRDHTTYEVEVRVPGTAVVERHAITAP